MAPPHEIAAPRGAAAMQGEGSRSRFLACLLLLWLCGIALRLTVLAVPPVIPLIHADLALPETGIGVLSSLPSLLFALAAVPGSLLIARLGALATLILGLLLTALAGALRGAASDAAMLYATTFAMSLGIAVMQPSLPPIVRDWLPRRIGFGTAVYSNGLLIGEILPVALTIPLLLPALGGSWRWSFVAWSLPVAATALLVALIAPGVSRRAAGGPGSAPPARRRWWPDWRSALIWRLGIILGSGQSVYFASNAFLPDYLHALGRPDLIGPALTSLNLAQLPASFILLAFSGRLTLRAWPYLMGAGLFVAGGLGVVLMPGEWVIAWSGLLGFTAAFVLILSLALPPLLSAPDDVHRVSAAMFTISYACAMIMPVLGGLAWDLTGWPAIAFLPVGLCALAIFLLAPFLDFAARERPAA